MLYLEGLDLSLPILCFDDPFPVMNCGPVASMKPRSKWLFMVHFINLLTRKKRIKLTVINPNTAM